MRTPVWNSYCWSNTVWRMPGRQKNHRPMPALPWNHFLQQMILEKRPWENFQGLFLWVRVPYQALMWDFPVPNHPYIESVQCSWFYVVLSGDTWCVVVCWFPENSCATICRYTRYFPEYLKLDSPTPKTLTLAMLGFFFFIYSYNEGVVSSVLSG